VAGDRDCRRWGSGPLASVPTRGRPVPRCPYRKVRKAARPLAQRDSQFLHRHYPWRASPRRSAAIRITGYLSIGYSVIRAVAAAGGTTDRPPRIIEELSRYSGRLNRPRDNRPANAHGWEAVAAFASPRSAKRGSLVHVLLHIRCVRRAPCRTELLPRIVHGQKSTDFLKLLVERDSADADSSRARIPSPSRPDFSRAPLQSPLWAAIRQPRQPFPEAHTQGRMIERRDAPVTAVCDDREFPQGFGPSDGQPVTFLSTSGELVF